MTIISHKYKFIFLKTFKTAGSSVELSLSRYCGKNDVITPLGGEEDLVRKEEIGVSPQNYYSSPRLNEYTPKDFMRLLLKQRKPIKEILFERHMPASQVRKKIGDEIWNSYFKFCFVRNPWDRAISNYYFMKGNGIVNTLEEALQPKHGLNNNTWIYTINHEIAVNKICKYENLLEELTVVCQGLGLPFDGWLPKLKGNYRSDKQHYSEILNENQANYIGKICAKEIEWFGYDYEHRSSEGKMTSIF